MYINITSQTCYSFELSSYNRVGVSSLPLLQLFPDAGYHLKATGESETNLLPHQLIGKGRARVGPMKRSGYSWQPK